MAANTTSPTVSTTTTHSVPEKEGQEEPDDISRALSYVFLPIGAVVFILLTTAAVLLVIRKRRLDRLRHHLMPLYNFDITECEQDDLEAELLDDTSDSQNIRRGYKSMEFPPNRNVTGFF